VLNSTFRGLMPLAVSVATLSSTPVLAVPPPTHVYELNFSFADSLGGPPLTPNGQGRFVETKFGSASPAPPGSRQGYLVPAHDSGLTLVGGLSAYTYSVELQLRLDGFPDPSQCVSGNQICSAKIIDLADRTDDHGFYTPTSDGKAGNGRLQVCCDPVADSPEGAIVYRQPVHLLFTRDGATKEVRGYVNGVLQWSAFDPLDNVAFDGPDSVAHFLMDDFAFVDDAPLGFVDRIVIYDQVLSANDAARVAGESVY
jgi:hypothetical protein